MVNDIVLNAGTELREANNVSRGSKKLYYVLLIVVIILVTSLILIFFLWK